MHPIDPHYPNLRILSLNEEVDIKRLLLLLSPKYEPANLSILEDESYLTANKDVLKLPAARLAEFVLDDNMRSFGIKSVIVEAEYIDRDTNATYAQINSRAFRDYPRRTMRLHFFTRKLASLKSELVNEELLQKSYVGFCILSNTQPGIIGRTVLPSPKGDKSWFFIPAQSKFPVNLSGAQLCAEGTTFMQQDGRVAACASAATWMSTTVVSKQLGLETSKFTMADITELGTKYTFPPSWGGSQRGLKIEQILWALHEMGYDPLSHEVKEPDNAAELTYSYVESGIPPILVVYLPNPGGFHAITAVGHAYDPLIPLNQLATQINSTAHWCPYFLVHDDQIGPYIKVQIGPANIKDNKHPSIILDENDSLLKSQCDEHRKKICEWYKDASLCYVIAPLPPRHVLRPEQASVKAKAIISKACSQYKGNLEKLGEKFPEPAIFRTYFTRSNDFRKCSIMELKYEQNENGSLPIELAHWYRGSIYPRYIWVTEVCALENRLSKQPDDIRILADVTIDPTSSPYSLDFVTLHLPHFFFRMPPNSISFADVLANSAIYIKEDHPYQPLVRLNTAREPILSVP